MHRRTQNGRFMPGVPQINTENVWFFLNSYPIKIISDIAVVFPTVFEVLNGAGFNRAKLVPPLVNSFFLPPVLNNLPKTCGYKLLYIIIIIQILLPAAFLIEVRQLKVNLIACIIPADIVYRWEICGYFICIRSRCLLYDTSLLSVDNETE